MTLNVLNEDQCQRITQNLPVRTLGKGFLRELARDRLLLMLMLDAGLRVGEVVQLQLRHFYTGGELNQAIFVSADISKAGSDRSIPMSQTLKKTFKDFIETPPLPLPFILDMFIFPGRPKSKHISSRQVRRIITDRCYGYIGQRVRPHDLRHTFATRLMRTTNIRVVQILLGHQSLQSTQIYTHPNDVDLQKAIDSV